MLTVQVRQDISWPTRKDKRRGLQSWTGDLCGNCCSKRERSRLRNSIEAVDWVVVAKGHRPDLAIVVSVHN